MAVRRLLVQIRKLSAAEVFEFSLSIAISCNLCFTTLAGAIYDRRDLPCEHLHLGAHVIRSVSGSGTSGDEHVAAHRAQRNDVSAQPRETEADERSFRSFWKFDSLPRIRFAQNVNWQSHSRLPCFPLSLFQCNHINVGYSDNDGNTSSASSRCAELSVQRNQLHSVLVPLWWRLQSGCVSGISHFLSPIVLSRKSHKEFCVA